MPPVERMDMKDRAVLWGYIRSGRDGEPLIDRPVEILCRWEEGQIEIPNPDGSFLTVDIVLATKQDFPLNSILWEGQLVYDDTFLSPDGTTYPASGPTLKLYEAVTRTRAKDIKGRGLRYEFGLRRYKDKLPTVRS